jgi:hypothetical protein
MNEFEKLKMKTTSLFVVLISAILLSTSCRKNRLKTSEKELVKDLIEQENKRTEADKAAREKQLAQTGSRNLGAVRYSEDRSIDPSLLPVKIDIANNLENIKDLKLTDIGSGITYIRMEQPPDSTIPSDLKSRYYLMDNYIVAINLYGIHLYGKDGRYIRRVVKNEMTGVEVTSDRIMFWNDYSMKGGVNVTGIKGNSLFYTYSNNITGQRFIMEYDCSSSQLSQDYKFDPEDPDRISGLGNISIDLNHGNTVPPPPRKHQGMFSGSHDFLFYDAGIHILDRETYASPARRGENMLVVLNNQGDTVSEFTRREKLVNYTKNLMRGTDGGAQYEKDGSLYLRPAFNDTVFIVSPPNRMRPVYVLNLGTYKVTKQEGVDPGFNLTGKIIPGEWAETDNYIFLTFTKDDYDCPNTREKKTVKIYHAVYLKNNRQLFIVKGDPFNYKPELLENNIDGGVPVWPAFYMIGRNSEIMVSLKGKELKERVRSKEFGQSGAPEAGKKELERLAGVVGETEDILMIIK